MIRITAERLREVLRYDRDAGRFYWLSLPHKCASNIKVGDLAGWTENTGYRRINIDGHRYVEHHLVWLYMVGEWPPGLDHKNKDKADNRWSNLRLATKEQNARNRGPRSDNALGIAGVRLHENGRYQGRIYAHGKFQSKTFERLADAIVWRRSMAEEIFGEYAP